MSLLGRLWVSTIAVIAIVLAVLSLFSVLQHDVIFSQLIRQRLAVTVEGTARPFRSVVEMGLPVSMMRNKRDLLERARGTDPAIKEVVLFNPSGIVVESTPARPPGRIPREVLQVQLQSIDSRWSLETDTELISGASIRNEAGTVVGGILAVYPGTELKARSAAVARQIGLASAGLFVLFSAIAYLILRARLKAVVKGLGRLEHALASLGHEGRRAAQSDVSSVKLGLLGNALDKLEEGLDDASRKYKLAKARLEALLPEDAAALALDGARELVLVGVPETALTRSFARRLTPVIAALALGSALALGYVAYLSINESFRPEIVKRTLLIGTDAAANIQRTIEAGVPIDKLVGGLQYFDHILADFPEISYFSVVTDEPVLEVGKHSARARSTRSSFPITIGGEKVGEIVTETNPDYIATQFRDVVLDLGVVVLVIILFAFELIVVVMAISVTGPLDRLHHLVDLQAGGDFSKRLIASTRSEIERLGTSLSERAERLNALFAAARRAIMAGAASNNGPSSREVLGPGFRLAGRRPAVLRFCSSTDIRLPLFLFAMADELPLSFFALYARAAENPFTWLSDGFAIGLPFAAYLLTALLSAPFARPLGKRFGYRRLFVAAAVLTVFAKLGLFYAHNIFEVVLFHSMNGIGFAFASLACQDYVLDMLPKGARSRSMSLFRTTLFSGVFAATALGGILADRLGQRPVFIICAGLAIAAAVLIWRLLPVGQPTIASGDERAEEERLSFNVLAPMRNAQFAAIALGIVIPQAIIDHVFISYLLALQMDEMGRSVSDIARVMMCFFLMLVLAGSLQGKLWERFRRPASVLAGSSILAGVVLLAAATMPSTWTILLAASSAGFALGMSGGPLAVLIMESAEGPLAHLGTSTVLGAVRVLERGGSIIGLLLIGAVTDYAGYSGATGIIGLITLAGAAGFVLLFAQGRKAIGRRNP